VAPLGITRRRGGLFGQMGGSTLRNRNNYRPCFLASVPFRRQRLAAVRSRRDLRGRLVSRRSEPHGADHRPPEGDASEQRPREGVGMRPARVPSHGRHRRAVIGGRAGGAEAPGSRESVGRRTGRGPTGAITLLGAAVSSGYAQITLNCTNRSQLRKGFRHRDQR
jgi:hypothetical protein